MTKRTNNPFGRRSYGGKPYDANNSFVKKMATKVTDLIPQRSWISKWFNASQDNGEVPNEDGNLEGEEETQQPPVKRPRIRMDITHPPGTFSIRARDKDASNNHDSRIANESEEYFLEPAIAGPSGACKFVSSTPAVNTDVRNTNSQRSRPISHVPMGNNVTSNGADDNSESGESTSGCSSLIPQTNRQEGASNSAYGSNLLGGRSRFIDDKSSFANHLQSPRCLFLESSGNRESLASRRPSFNASMMNNNGNNIERSASLSSPFYTGNVTFGGANALGNYKRSRSLFNSNNEFQLKIPRRTSVQVKPSSTECIDASGMSQTAKRILEAMEYFSSPISDAKKIPVKNPAEMSMGKKRMRDDRPGSSSGPVARVGLRHLTRELAVPTVPEMLKLRRRQKLQDTTVAARKIISAMSGPPPSSSWTATTMTTAPTAAVASEDYHLRTELDQSPKYHGKLRGKLKKNSKEEGPAPSVNLPSISLPITSLPSFEPLPKYTIPSTVSNRTENRETESDYQCGFKFASPIKITEAAWSLKSINNFSFSKPINASESSSEPRAEYGTASTSPDSKISSNSCVDGVATNFMWSGSSTAPRLKVKTKQRDESREKTPTIFGSSAVKEMDKLKSGPISNTDSVISRSTTSNRALYPEIWECSECYIKNDSSESTCVACKASKPRGTGNAEISSGPIANSSGKTGKFHSRKSNPADTGFGSQFKMSVNQWKCESCLVRNKTSSLKCASCSSPKPDTTKPAGEAPTSVSTAPARNDLAGKLKPAKGSWECPGCMLRNPSTVITCPCCSASKPSLVKASSKNTSLEGAKSSKQSGEIGDENSKLMDKFKPAASSWECSSCMVRNSDTASSCVCCSSAKPGVTKSSDTALPRVESGWGDKFKKPEGSWSCDSCMLQNKSEVNECVACNAAKPGTIPQPRAASSQFSFGIPANDQNFKFGIPTVEVKSKWGESAKSPQTNVDPSQFTFGMPKETEKEAAKIPANPTGGFVFASPKNSNGATPKLETSKSNNEIARDSSKSEGGGGNDDEKKSAVTFLFGLPKSVDKRPESLGDDSTREARGEEATRSNSGKVQFVFGVPKSEENRADDGKSRFDPPTREKPSIFGNLPRTTAATSNESNNVQAVGTMKSSSGTSEDEQGKTISSSITSPRASVISTQARSPFTFSEPKSKLASQSSSINPSFGQTSGVPAVPTFLITDNPAIRETNLKPPETEKKPLASNFGIHNSTTPLTSFGNVPSSSPSTILGDASSLDSKTCFAPAANQKSTFFGITGDKRTPVFGATLEKKSQIFGNSENKLPAAFGSSDKPITNNNLFNSVATSSSSTASASSSFGGNTGGPSQPVFGSSTAPVFGGNTAAPSFASGSGTANIFATGGKTSVTPANNQGLFTFGGASSQQITNQPAPGGFSFATDPGDSSVSATKPIFPFGSTSGTAQPSANECFGGAGTNAGAFGTPAAATSTNPQPSPFTFNAPSNKQETHPAFGQASTTIPNMFGAQTVQSGIGQAPTASTFAPNAPVSSTGFSFGTSAPSTISGGFNFGGAMAQPAAAPSGGFNFNAAAPSPATAFDPNTRPSFNFTGGTAPPAFNATPQSVAARKIKKAVRRMQQR